MTILDIHTEIAKERFLESMAQANGSVNPRLLAEQAIEEADIFIEAYSKRTPPYEALPVSPKLKGCRACHGSGGKAASPCKVCKGTGKVIE